jgi:hypothetical protein
MWGPVICLDQEESGGELLCLLWYEAERIQLSNEENSIKCYLDIEYVREFWTHAFFILSRLYII